MHLRASASGIEVWTPAKLNLFLEVLAKRDDGYHEIETLMWPINLYDTLYFRSEKDFRSEQLTCEWASGAWGFSKVLQAEKLPEGTDNIVVRAVQMLRRHAGTTAGASLRLIKRIPAAAGLAGGSSDAAAALVAANRGWALGLSDAELHRVAAEVGSDVPFFLASGPAVCRGRGERIEALEGPARGGPAHGGTGHGGTGRTGLLHFVVVCPPEGLRTADVYRICRPSPSPTGAAPLLDVLRTGRTAAAGRLLHNGLQPHAAILSPWVNRLQREFESLGLLGHAMSGSGTSYFGLCRNARQARLAAKRLQGRGVGRIYAVRDGF